MNCQDLALILDERDISRLSAVERAQVGAHLVVCPDCAREWELHRRLTAQPVPPVPADLEARCRTLVAASGSRGSSSRTVLIGTVLVVAAAAAMLAMRLNDSWNTPTAAVLSAPVPAPAVPAPPEEIPRGPEIAVVPEELPKQFTVRVLPLRHKTDEPLARTHVQQYYEKLLEGLGAVPGIALLGPETANAANPRPDMQITVTTQAIRRFEVPAGMPVPAGISTALWNAAVEIATWPRKDVAPPGTVNDGALIEPGCLPEMQQLPETPPCQYESTAAAAAQRLELLRVDYFPDRSFAREVQARLAAQMNDPALDLPVRLNSFARLVEMRGASVDANTHEGVRARRMADLGHGANLEWDAAMVRGALDLLAAADPQLRLGILRRLSGIKHPDLVPALIAMLQTQTDWALRDEAARILSVDFGDDPAAQAALAAMAAADSSEIMRLLAERAQSGDGAWRAHVSDAVMNTSRPTAERLRPAIDMLEYFTNEDALAILGKKEVVMELVKLLPEFWSSNQDALLQRKSLELLMTLDPLSGGTRQDVKDAIIDLNVEALRKSSDSLIRFSATQFLGAWGINLPRVVKALEDVAANDPNPDVKNAAIGHIERTAPCRQQPATCAAPTADVMLANNDANKDGIITREEAAKFNGRLIQTWDTYDTNKDGKVDVTEINKALAARAAGGGAAPAAPAAPAAK